MSKNNNGNGKTNGDNGDNPIEGAESGGKVDGKAGNDTAAGGSGDDWVKGGSGNDVLDGGAGNDRVDGGSGDDRLIYRLADNAATSDAYDGGAHEDVLVLVLTRDEWMRDDVQADIAAYLQFLAAGPGKGAGTGQRFFFASLNLEVRKVESLEVTVDGVAQDPRDEAVVAFDDVFVTEGEHSVVTGNVVDNDGVPDIVRSVELIEGPTKGLLDLNDDGSFEYDPGNEFDYLAVGETALISFTYRVTDADRDSATATMSITITGTNDKPIAHIDAGSTDENQILTVDVLANDTDVDTSDTHTVDEATIANGLGSVAIVSNKIEWTPGSDYDYLAVGETALVDIDYTMSDNNSAESSSRLTITVTGSNDGPVANLDSATTAENDVIAIDVLENDTDVDASDTHEVVQATIISGLGAVTLADNKVQWAPGADYDYLAVGDSAIVEIGYTMRDNHGAESSSTATLTVTGTNDRPTVEVSLNSTVSEEDAPYTIELLAGAADVDHGALLHVSGFSEAAGKGGWSIDGSTLTVNPDFYDALNDGQTEVLTFNYEVVDEHGAAVTQALDVNIEGFTDAPSLEVIASAGNAVNEIVLTISSQPARGERVMLNFNNLTAGAKVFNSAGVNVSAGVDNFIGTHLFTVLLPADQDTKGDLTIKVSGLDENGDYIASSSGVLDLDYAFSNPTETVVFNSQNQGIWASGDAPMVQWHEYVPLIGGVTRKWDAAEEVWEDTGTGTWNSGAFTVFSAGIDAEDVIDLALAVPRQILQGAKDVFNATANVVDSVVQATYDAARAAFNGAVSAAHSAFTAASSAALSIFNTAVSATAEAAASIAHAAYDAAVAVADGIRDAAIAVGGWLGQWVHDAANGAYNAAVALAAAALDVALDATAWTVEKATAAAQAIYDAAIESAAWVKETTLAAADRTFELAEAAYNKAKQLAYDTAEVIFDVAQEVYDTTAAALNTVQGETKLEVEADLYAEAGIQVDFVLDSGSVDTEVQYDLTSVVQHNRTTDVLAITPQFTNLTSGETVAFETISPNASFKAVLLYDVGANLNVFLDSNLIVAGTTIFDISPNSDGLNVATTISTSGFSNDLEYAEANGQGDSLAGIDVGELTLIDVNTADLEPFKVPFIESLTDDILSIHVALPTIETEGTAAAYDPEFFAEGGLIAMDLSEVTQSIMNLVNAKLDFSPQLREQMNLGSLADAATIEEAINLIGEAFLGVIFDNLDGQSERMPIFLIDATDETSSSLLHANFVPDSVMGNTLTADTGTFGFYTAYGESQDIVKVTIDIDQVVAVIVNRVAKAVAAAVTAGSAAPVVEQIPIINPLDLEFGLEQILKIVEAPAEVATEIKKFFNFQVGFEAADLDVTSGLKFSQEFSLSIDDMDYLVTLEDGEQFTFAANSEGALQIEEASSHDANGDGIVEYAMEIVPNAMFSNDTEINLTLGYMLDFLQANLVADFKLPISDLLGIEIPGQPSVTLNLANMHLGPLLRVQGDLDLASADIFESCFDFDIGSATVEGQYDTAEDTIVIVGVDPIAPDAGTIV